jgi:hypothetical protein
MINVFLICIIILLLFLSYNVNDCKNGKCNKKTRLTSDKIKQMMTYASNMSTPNTIVYNDPINKPYETTPSAEITNKYNELANELPPVTGFAINESVDPAMNAPYTTEPNLYFPWPANYDGKRLVRNARDFPLYGQPMPDKYEFGRMFYAEYPEISYKPGYW